MFVLHLTCIQPFSAQHRLCEEKFFAQLYSFNWFRYKMIFICVFIESFIFVNNFDQGNVKLIKKQ